INIVDDLLSLSIIENNDLLQSEADILLFKDPRNDKLGNKIFVTKNKFKEIEKKHNLIEDNFEKYRELLIKNLIPFSSEDLIQNKSLLLENNFDKINAIDWEKGCYVGQEITARMKYRALLKKQLYALELISGNINIGDKIEEKEVNLGQVVSKANQYIFCMLKIELVKEKSKKKSLLEINSFATLKFL
ncbi:MAG TPA: tRNA-modifying protein YgfZ, partial [Alphaproteobacteria bacterium]|nr:tRNA-modifying protein YgfZ [Alphaproteobacteria bacterium]